MTKQQCVRAFYGTSQDPERRGESLWRDYLATVCRLDELMDNEHITEEFRDRTLKSLDQNYSAWTSAMSRCMSTLVTGPANFPTRRNQKANDAEHRRCTELSDWLKYIENKIDKLKHPERRPVMAGDDDAVSRLEEKIQKAEEWQGIMKAANKVIKSKKLNQNEKIRKVMDVCSATEEAAYRLVTKSDWPGPGFPRFELTNNNANIRRMKQRLEKIKRDKAAPVFEKEVGDIRIEENRADNRVRIYFPGKPDAETRAALKSHGYRWSPKNTAWQAYINYRSVQYAKSFIQEAERKEA